MKRHFSVKPQAVTAATSTRAKISGLEDRIAEIKSRLAEPDLDEDERIDLGLDLAALEDELNFAWQDDEAEYDYALQQQEFNPDGSLKGYDDYDYDNEVGDGADLFVIKIWHEADSPKGGLPSAAEEIIEVYADSPDQALEWAKDAWSGPIDRIEIVDVNPMNGFEDLPYED